MTHPVVLTYGMGTDSTALLARWITDPATCPCPLEELLVVTAQAGDEWPRTGDLVERHMLPLFREHGIRYAQVARHGPARADGVTVLADTREPWVCHLGGDYRLSQEMTSAGTVPQAGGGRKCSAKAKGVPLDVFIGEQTAGQPYLQAVGFEATETRRAVRDAGFNTADRRGIYPLIEWGWDRAQCERYIREVLGVDWVKSACVYCPFALTNADGRQRVTAMFAQDPAHGVTGLLMEHLAVSLNPRQGLIAGKRLVDLLAITPGQEPTLALFTARLGQVPWSVYEVRRALLPKAGSGAANARRELTVHGTGTREAMTAGLAAWAAGAGADLTEEDGIARGWLRRRGDMLPTAEWFRVAAPAGADPKTGPGFGGMWDRVLAAPVQGELHAA